MKKFPLSVPQKMILALLLDILSERITNIEEALSSFMCETKRNKYRNELQVKFAVKEFLLHIFHQNEYNSMDKLRLNKYRLKYISELKSKHKIQTEEQKKIDKLIY